MWPAGLEHDLQCLLQWCLAGTQLHHQLLYLLLGWEKFRRSLLNFVFCRDDRQDNVLSKTSFRTADTRVVGQGEEAAKKVKEIMEMKKSGVSRSVSLA